MYILFTYASLTNYCLFKMCKVSFAEGKALDLGCFKDNTARRVTGHYFRDGNLSTEQCIKECRSRGYVYAALQVGLVYISI